MSTTVTRGCRKCCRRGKKKKRGVNSAGRGLWQMSGPHSSREWVGGYWNSALEEVYNQESEEGDLEGREIKLLREHHRHKQWAMEGMD